eukprot:5591911-Amphidinium_carterae.9
MGLIFVVSAPSTWYGVALSPPFLFSLEVVRSMRTPQRISSLLQPLYGPRLVFSLRKSPHSVTQVGCAKFCLSSASLSAVTSASSLRYVIFVLRPTIWVPRALVRAQMQLQGITLAMRKLPDLACPSASQLQI